jgi:hypothetical protein
MFYDIFLDEFLYLRGKESFSSDFKPDIFGGLVRYSENELKNFRDGKVTILSKEKDLSLFISMSRNVMTNNSKFYYGKIGKSLAVRISECLQKDVTGFNLSLQTHVLKHIQKIHGNPLKELSRKQIAVIDNDYALIPYVVTEADTIMLSNNVTECNNNVLIFKKQVRDILYQLVVYVSFKKHNLEVKTMYKKKKELATLL